MPQAKKARTMQKAPLKGRLALLKELPLDALLQIFSLLDCPDLLALSRSSKWQRAFVLDKSRETLWKQVYERASLPPVPRGSSLPAWAALLHDKICSGCGKLAQKVDYQLRKRYCVACAKKLLKNSQSLDVTCHMILAHSMIRVGNSEDTWPQFKMSRMERFGRAAVEYYDTRDLDAALALTADYTSAYGPQDFHSLYDTKDLEFAFKEVEEYKLAHPSIAAICAEAAAVIDESEAHAEKCKLWEKQVKEAKVEEASSQNQARQDAIRAKLTEMGYEMDALPDELWSDKLVDQPRALTDAIWKRIKPTLVTTIAALKARKVTERRFDMMKQYYGTFVKTPLDAQRPFLPSPSMGNVIELRTVATFMAAEHDATAADLEQAKETVRSEAIAWAEGVCAELESLIPAHAKIEGSVPIIARSSTLFRIESHDVPVLLWRNSKTKSKNRIMTFEQAFRDPKAMTVGKLINYSVWEMVPDETKNRALVGKKWKGVAHVQFDEKAYTTYNAMIGVAGLKPEDTTDAMLDSLGPRFVLDGTNQKLYRDFRTAVRAPEPASSYRLALPGEDTTKGGYDWMGSAYRHESATHYDMVLVVNSKPRLS